MTKHSGNLAHYEKTKPKNKRNRKRKEGQLKNSENILNKLIEENFPNLKKETFIKVEEACRTPIQLRSENKVQLVCNNQNSKHREQRKILKAAREKIKQRQTCQNYTLLLNTDPKSQKSMD